MNTTREALWEHVIRHDPVALMAFIDHLTEEGDPHGEHLVRAYHHGNIVFRSGNINPEWGPEKGGTGGYSHDGYHNGSLGFYDHSLQYHAPETVLSTSVPTISDHRELAHVMPLFGPTEDSVGFARYLKHQTGRPPSPDNRFPVAVEHGTVKWDHDLSKDYVAAHDFNDTHYYGFYRANGHRVSYMVPKNKVATPARLKLARTSVKPNTNPSLNGTQLHARLLHIASLDPTLAPIVARIVRGRGIHVPQSDAFSELGAALKGHKEPTLAAYATAYNWSRMKHTTELDEAISDIIRDHGKTSGGTPMLQGHDELLRLAGHDKHRAKTVDALMKHLKLQNIPVAPGHLSNRDHVERSLIRLRDSALERANGGFPAKDAVLLRSKPVDVATGRTPKALKFQRDQ